MTALRAEATGRGRRTRHGPPFTALPALRPAQKALLGDWLRSHAAERQWQTLLDTAGPDRLELADELLALLLECGALRTKERFVNAQWRVERIAWANVATLQQALGLATADTRAAARDALAGRLRTLADETPWLESAALHCLDARTTDAARQSRLELLLALQRWQQEQRFGLQRDFALFARGHTKAITATEWSWLQAHVTLEALGVAHFAPLLWLGGHLRLHTASGSLDVAATGLCGLPAQAFTVGLRAQAPQRYWLLENRASFERQALAAAPGTCVLWLPGQPSSSWREAVQYLLQAAPAPADISCDPDPAGVEIALNAGQLWQAQGLAWRAHRMSRMDWESAPVLDLSAHDQDWLERLRAKQDLPHELAQLCADLRATGRKAEQEAWL